MFPKVFKFLSDLLIHVDPCRLFVIYLDIIGLQDYLHFTAHILLKGLPPLHYNSINSDVITWKKALSESSSSTCLLGHKLDKGPEPRNQPLPHQGFRVVYIPLETIRGKRTQCPDLFIFFNQALVFAQLKAKASTLIFLNLPYDNHTKF